MVFAVMTISLTNDANEANDAGDTGEGTKDSGTGGSGGRPALWRLADFRRFWIGDTVSQAGDGRHPARPPLLLSPLRTARELPR